MAQMPAAVVAFDLGSLCEEPYIFRVFHRIGCYRLCETGPASGRLELGLRAKKRLSAPRADVGALIRAVPILP